MLRRCIALAELIGLPRAAHATPSTQITASKFYASSQEAAAGVWESICVVDRIAGLMFNLPVGTAAYGLSTDMPVMSPEGNVIVSDSTAKQHLFSASSQTSEHVLDIDEFCVYRSKLTSTTSRVSRLQFRVSTNPTFHSEGT